MTHSCRACGTPLKQIFADLGRSPLSNAFRTREQLEEAEYTLPLRVYVCHECQLVQMPAYEHPVDIFSTDYAYFTSASPTAVQHAEDYAVMMARRLELDHDSLVVEVASNDGYLLQHFKDMEIPVIGVDPALNVARVAIDKGIPTCVGFFGEDLARQLVEGHQQADLIHAANVLAHVPNIHDFVAGFKVLLKPEGIITFEFPHLFHLIKGVLLDTIYHEHYSYLSLWALEPIFNRHNLRVYDVDILPTHGGSLRLYVCKEDATIREKVSVNELRAFEADAGLTKNSVYMDFQLAAEKLKYDLVEFLIEQRRRGKRVVGYGAPAKATTLLNYCGIDHDLIEYTVDASPAKQGKFIPGTHIEIHDEEFLLANRPDYVLIFAWNLADALIKKSAVLRERDTKFITAVPRLTLHA